MNVWLTSWDDKLRRLYHTGSNHDLAIYFGVDRKTIYRHAKRLGLSKERGVQYERVDVSLAVLEDLIIDGLTGSEIAQEVGRHRKHIYKRCRELRPGLRRMLRANVQRKRAANYFYNTRPPRID